MLQIKDTLVSLDLIERFFVCDLDACLGACCVEGDAGAPLAPGEQEAIEAVLDSVKDLLTPAALREIEENGVAYTDPDGDLVTSIVDGRDCVFTRYEAGGKCLCPRVGFPGRQNPGCETYIVPSLSGASQGLRRLYRSKSSPLENMQMCRDSRACPRSESLRIPTGSAGAPFRQGLVAGTRLHSKGMAAPES